MTGDIGTDQAGGAGRVEGQCIGHYEWGEEV